MNNIKQHVFGSVGRMVILMIMSGLAGCKLPQSRPVHQADTFNPAEVDRIVVLPAVDLRPEKSIDIDLSKCSDQCYMSTKWRKYDVVRHDEADALKNLTEEELANPQPEWIQSLGPTDARWVMVIAVHDLTRKVSFGKSANAEISAALFDKQAQKCVWRNKAVGQYGQGGPIGFMMPAATAALETAAMTVMEGLPIRPKTKK